MSIEGIKEYKTTRRQFRIDEDLPADLDPICPDGTWWNLVGHTSFTCGGVGGGAKATILWFWSRSEFEDKKPAMKPTSPAPGVG